MREEKIFCPRCEKAGKKIEMFFLSKRDDRPAQYWCYACDYMRRQGEAEEKQIRRRIICY